VNATPLNSVNVHGTGRISVPARCQTWSGERPGIGQWHRAGVADARPHSPPVVLGVHEVSSKAGRQDPDAESAEFRVADLANGLSGFECVDQALGKAAIGHGISPETVALANRNRPNLPVSGS